MAFMRHDFARGALPDRFSRVPIDAQDVELVIVRRCLDVKAAATAATRSRAIAVGVGRGLFALEAHRARVGRVPEWTPFVRGRLWRGRRSIGLHRGEDKNAISPNDWRCASAAWHGDLPLDVFRGRPLGRRISLRGNSGGLRTAPLMPVVDLLLVEFAGLQRES